MLVNRVKIEADVIPSSYAVLSISVVNIALDYAKSIVKTFTYGTPPSSSWVQIGANKTATLQNLFDNLVANDQDGNMVFSIAGDILKIDFNDPAIYTLTVTNDAFDAYIVTAEEFEYTIPETPLDTFAMKHLQIEIIDTYDNEMPLNVEVARSNACVLSYDGGDDIYEPLYTSSLKFDMRVADFSDAHFLHLFTGDEKRFLVRLNAINEEEDETRLYWQGYLLPDMLREPYTNNNLFVEFEAIDMLASLKGKFFKPWEYYQTYNISVLLAKIFAQTGLEQPMVVKPSIVPAGFGINWRSINVPLLTYVDGTKYTDLYTILTEILSSNLLTLKSFKGTWFIEGVTRKNETTGNALFFDADGVYQYQDTYTKEFVYPDPVRDSLVFSAMTPWKTVVADFEDKGDSNLLPEDVVDKENFFLLYANGEFVETSASTALMNYWKKTGTKITLNPEKSILKMKSGQALNGAPYNVSAPESLINYVDLNDPFYLSPKYAYEIELEINFRKATRYFGTNTDQSTEPPITFFENIDNWVPLQLIHNNVEIITNRTSTTATVFKWFVENARRFKEDTPSAKFVNEECVLKFSRRFVVNEGGFANLRFLASVANVTADYTSLILERFFEISPRLLKINVFNTETEGISGTRPVNYTNIYKHPLTFISAPDLSIKTNMGLGNQQTPTEETIIVASQSFNPAAQDFPNGDVLFINNWLFEVNASVFKKMFKDGRLKSMFVVRASGDEEHFYSWYGRAFSTGQVVHYVNTFDVGALIPSDYKEQAKIEAGDTLKMLLSNYPSENLNNRGNWKIYGDTVTQSFMRSVVLACHNVRPSQLWVMEGTFLDLVWPDQIQQFQFDGLTRNFINTRLTLDLFNGKTSVYGREFKYENLTDVTYE